MSGSNETDKFELAMRFLSLAKQGRSPAASGGEQRAYRLAKRLKVCLDDLAGLDASAVDGLCTLMRAASNGGYNEVSTLLRSIK